MSRIRFEVELAILRYLNLAWPDTAQLFGRQLKKPQNALQNLKRHTGGSSFVQPARCLSDYKRRALVGSGG